MNSKGTNRLDRVFKEWAVKGTLANRDAEWLLAIARLADPSRHCGSPGCQEQRKDNLMCRAMESEPVIEVSSKCDHPNDALCVCGHPKYRHMESTAGNWFCLEKTCLDRGDKGCKNFEYATGQAK